MYIITRTLTTFIFNNWHLTKIRNQQIRCFLFVDSRIGKTIDSNHAMFEEMLHNANNTQIIAWNKWSLWTYLSVFYGSSVEISNNVNFFIRTISRLWWGITRYSMLSYLQLSFSNRLEKQMFNHPLYLIIRRFPFQRCARITLEFATIPRVERRECCNGSCRREHLTNDFAAFRTKDAFSLSKPTESKTVRLLCLFYYFFLFSLEKSSDC